MGYQTFEKECNHDTSYETTSLQFPRWQIAVVAVFALAGAAVTLSYILQFPSTPNVNQPQSFQEYTENVGAPEPQEIPLPEDKPTSNSTFTHIVFFLVDDAGYNDFGYSSEDITQCTPFLDQLAEGGVKLTRYYSEHSCTPARAALLSGMSPMLVGMQHGNIDIEDAWGMPVSFDTLPNKLKDLGYKTHLVGKWDIGHFAPQYWPTSRGFDSHMGYLGCCFGNVFKHTKDHVVDLHTNMINEYEFAGTFATYMWETSSIDIINDHDTSEPLFLMVSLNAPHHPTDIPPGFNITSEYTKSTSGAQYELRSDFAANMKLVDNVAVSIVMKLKKKSIYDNSVIVVTSDNGAPSSSSSDPNGGSNWPLRGKKGTVFEGGLRVPAFVHSPLLGASSRNRSLHSLFHVTDWLPTLVEGVALRMMSNATGSTPGVGVNQWSAIQDPDLQALRTEISTMIDYVEGADLGAVIVGDYKFIRGQKCEKWYVPDTGEGMGLNNVTCDGDDDNVKRRLYNLMEDPSEAVNLYDNPDYSEIQNKLVSRFCYYYENIMDDSVYRPTEDNQMQYAASQNDGFLTYWKDDANDTAAYPKRHYSSWFCKSVGQGVREGSDISAGLLPSPNVTVAKPIHAGSKGESDAKSLELLELKQ